MKDTMKVTKFITITGMLSAIAIILYTYLEFPILPAYAFLQYDFSDVVAVIGAIFISPLSGILIQLLKNIIHFFIKASAGGLGELANLLTGLLFILPIIFLFKKMKLYSFIIASLTFIAGALILNYFIFLPLYGIPKDARLDMLRYGILPFNAIKSVITSLTSIALWRLLLPFKNRLAL